MGARRIAIGTWLALLAVGLAVIANSRFVADLSSFLPAAPSEQQRLLVDQLRDGAISRVMLIGIRGGDAAGRAALSRGSPSACAPIRVSSRCPTGSAAASSGSAISSSRIAT